METLVISLKNVAASLNRTRRWLEKRLDVKTGRIALGVGTLRTIKLGGSCVVITLEFERFLREAGIVVQDETAAPETTPTPTPARRGRPRLSATAGGEGGV